MENRETKYKIRLEGPGILHEEEVEREVFDEVHQFLLNRRLHRAGDGLKGTREAEGESGFDPHLDPAGLEIHNFVIEHNARRNPDKLITVAYFLREHQGRDKVTREQLRQVFEAAGFRSVNFGRDLHWACQVKWLKNLGGQKRLREHGKKIQTLRLTEAGVAAIRAKFDEETLRQSRQPR